MRTDLRLLQEVPGIPDVAWSILARLGSERQGLRILFAAAEQRAGTTVIAAATALALARHLRAPVALIETDVRRPGLAGYLGLRMPGLSDVLDGRARLPEVVQTLDRCPNLRILTAGNARNPIPGEFATARTQALIAEIAAGARYVVIDAPPLLDRLESRVLLQQCDGAVLVLRARSTRTDQVDRARQILMESGTVLLGSVLNAYRSAFATGREAGTYDPIPQTSSSAPPPPAPPLAPPPPEAPAAAGPVPAVPPLVLPSGMISEAEHNRVVELLERRIARLNDQLARLEADLQQLAALKDFDPGIASVYRTIQGLSPLDAALASKKDLMKKIFDANLELKQAMDRRRAAGTALASQQRPRN